MELHRCRFVDYMPSGIVALAFSPQTYTPSSRSQTLNSNGTSLVAQSDPKDDPTFKIQRKRSLPAPSSVSYLACVRENSDIEIYNPRPPAATSRGFFLEKTIPGGPSASTECIVWTHQIQLTPYPDPSDPADPNGVSSMALDDDDDDDRTAAQAEARRKEEEARMAGVPPRLFSAGLDGLIHEWDMNTLRPKTTVESNGGSVWCMAVNHIHTRLAVGCEDGCIRIFNVADGSLVYLRSFWRQEGRILSIAWDHTGRYVYSGSSDSSVRRFDTHSGLCIDRFTVGSTVANRLALKPKRGSKMDLGSDGEEEPTTSVPKRGGGGRTLEQTIVWTIAALADGTVVSGDSRGIVSFWNGKTGELRQSQKAHAADILCMASNAAGNVVFTAGVDRQIVQFKYTVLSHSTGPALSGPSVMTSDQPHLKRWIMTAQKRYHSHDVRALALLEGRPVDSLVSGGVDTQLTISQPASEFPIVSHIRLPPFPLQPLISVSRGARAVMCRYLDRVKVWKVGTGIPPVIPLSDLADGTRIKLGHKHRLWFEIAPKVSSHLTASAISDNGNWVALADLESVKLFKIDTTSGKPRIRKVKPEGYATPLLPEGVGATAILFTPDSGRMVVAGCDATVVVTDLREDSVEVVKRFRFHCGDDHDEDDGVKRSSRGRKRWESVCSLAVSSDGQWLASGDKANRIYIYNLDALKLHATIPRYPTPHTSVTFHPVSPTLIVTLHSNEVFLFDVETTERASVLSASTDSVPQCRLTDWSREYSHRLPRRLISKTEPARGVVVPPGRNDTLILWASSWMCTVDLKRPPMATRRTATTFRTPSGGTKRKSTTQEQPDLATPSKPSNDTAATPKLFGTAVPKTHAETNGTIVIEDSDDDEVAPEEEEDTEAVGNDGATTAGEDSKSQKQRKKKTPRPRGKVNGFTVHRYEDEDDVDSPLKFIERFAPIMGIGFIAGADEDGSVSMVAVERPVLEVVKKLPASFYRHKYGT
ncbi:quinon protein alcohol dehydrogenase-like superfamily [Cladochytrium replicatum]|nr:quinon protein alcohol dehydrogenase-like superfamily [Cladochytrium replicatum]